MVLGIKRIARVLSVSLALVSLCAAATTVEARADATAAYEADRIEAARGTVWVTGCNSWYLDAHGVPAAWPWKFQRFRDVMATPDLSAFELQGGTT